MGEEKGKRRRGHRRGRGSSRPDDRYLEEKPGEDQPEVEEESEAPGVLPSRFRFRFRRRGGGEEEKAEERHGRSREETPAAGASPNVSPLAFWRRGRPRPYREQPMPKQTLGRTLRRVRGLHVPPWTPVMFIIVVVFGILAALFFARGASGQPRIGDHWHSTYEIVVCGLRQPNVRTFDGPGNNGTHGDGVIHNHPSLPQGEGRGAALDRWFDGGGGKLTKSEMSIPFSRKEYKNGDTCPDGSVATLQVFANGEKLDDWSRFIPKDGDQLRIVFGPEEVEPVRQQDRTIIAESQATRTVELEVSGGEADVAFSPASIDLSAGETVKLAVTNTGSISHSVRVAGADGEYRTSDDYVSDPEIILPGEDGAVVVRFDEVGQYDFQDPSSPQATGNLVVQEEGETAEATEESPDGEEVDVTFEIEMGDNFFGPAELEVEAGQTFRINLTNTGQFVHNLHIAGVDGEYETADDIESEPSFQRVGETGSLVAQIDEPGVYEFRCDFHPTDQLGTITVR